TGFFGLTLFCFGFPDQGLAQTNAAVVEARTLGDPPAFAVSLSNGTRLLSLFARSRGRALCVRSFRGTGARNPPVREMPRSQWRNAEVRLTDRWREMDSNPRSPGHRELCCRAPLVAAKGRRRRNRHCGSARFLLLI